MADMTLEEAVKVIAGLKNQVDTLNREHTEEMKRLYVEHAAELDQWKTAPKDLIAVRKQAALDMAQVNTACTKRDALIGKIEAAIVEGGKTVEASVALLPTLVELFDEYKHG